MITGYDHVQVAIPAGGEPVARAFYGDALGMTEVPKPPALVARGGCWFTSGGAVLHLGVDPTFAPADKAHPAFLVTDLDAVAAGLAAAGHAALPADGEIPGVRRLHAFDPFGNRLEFQQARLASTHSAARGLHRDLVATARPSRRQRNKIADGRSSTGP